jgi:ribosomal protein S18 acetylase RimI-like enzyme
LRSAAQIWLHVDTANSAAIRLYERHNFILHKTIDNFYPNGGAAHLYRKNIESK